MYAAPADTRSESVVDPAAAARRKLLRFFAVAATLMLFVQLILALSSWRALIPTALLIAVLSGAFLWIGIERSRLARLPFGTALAHAGLFVITTTTNSFSALLAAIDHGTQGASVEQIGQALFGTPWFRMTFVGGCVWGILVAIHLLCAVLLFRPPSRDSSES